MLVVADIAVAPVAIISGLSLVLILLVVGFCEAIVLRILGWGTLGQSMRDSLVMNIVSTVIGWFIAQFNLEFSPSAALFPLLIAWFLSVLTEGGTLLLLKRHGARATWRAALSANTVSYVLLAAFLYGVVWAN